MGIKGLNSFIKKICPECIKIKSINEFKNKVFAIDASILLYKYVHISNVNSNLENAHIIGFLNRIKMYKDNSIKPIFIFDGIPPDEKRETLKKRQLVKKKITDKIFLLKELAEKTIEEEKKKLIEIEISKLSTQIVYVTKTHIDDCKKLLDVLGISYFNAPDEAEKYCVFLYKNKLVDYIVSDDTDVFTFGGYNVIKTTMKNNLTEFDLKIFLDKINYTHEKFIDFCILSGCDYLSYVPNLAINTVYNLFKKFDKIEDIISLKKYNFPDEYNIEKIRKLFNEFNYDIPIIENNNYNKTQFENFLIEKKIKNNQKYLNNFNLN